MHVFLSTQELSGVDNEGGGGGWANTVHEEFNMK